MPDQENVKDPSAHPLISSSPLPTLSTSSPFLTNLRRSPLPLGILPLLNRIKTNGLSRGICGCHEFADRFKNTAKLFIIVALKIVQSLSEICV